MFTEQRNSVFDQSSVNSQNLPRWYSNQGDSVFLLFDIPTQLRLNNLLIQILLRCSRYCLNTAKTNNIVSILFCSYDVSSLLEVIYYIHYCHANKKANNSKTTYFLTFILPSKLIYSLMFRTCNNKL